MALRLLLTRSKGVGVQPQLLYRFASSRYSGVPEVIGFGAFRAYRGRVRHIYGPTSETTQFVTSTALCGQVKDKLTFFKPWSDKYGDKATPQEVQNVTCKRCVVLTANLPAK